LCLTDGDDNASTKPFWQVAKFLQQNNIVLDSIPVYTSGLQLQSMAIATGGLSLKVTDAEKGVALFEREAVINLSVREVRTNPLPEIHDEKSCLQLAQGVQAVEDVKQAVPQAVNSRVMTAETIKQVAATQAAEPTPASGQPVTRVNNGGKRLMKEYMDGAVPETQYFVAESDLFSWKVIFNGPAGSPYNGGKFLIFVNFPQDYPFRPPKLQFITPIYHCNINNDGRVCMDILTLSWSPALTLNRVMTSLQELLITPNPLDALDAVKANVFSDDRAKYMKNAADHCKQHASETDEQLKQRYNF